MSQNISNEKFIQQTATQPSRSDSASAFAAMNFPAKYKYFFSENTEKRTMTLETLCSKYGFEICMIGNSTTLSSIEGKYGILSKHADDDCMCKILNDEKVLYYATLLFNLNRNQIEERDAFFLMQ